LGIGDWAQSPIPNPQSPIPNPQSPINDKEKRKINNYYNLKLIYFLMNIKKFINGIIMS